MNTVDPLEFQNEDFGMTESPSEVIEKDYINAKSFLLNSSTLTGLNLYDHLARVLGKILECRPENAVDTFEDVSNEEKKTRFSAKVDTILDKREKTTEIQLAEFQKKLFLTQDGSYTRDDEDLETPLPNVMQLCYYFEQAGIGLNREEMMRIWLSLKTLVDKHPIQQIRFWGKIFGIEHNYLVAEVAFRDGEEEEYVNEINPEESWEPMYGCCLPFGKGKKQEVEPEIPVVEKVSETLKKEGEDEEEEEVEEEEEDDFPIPKPVYKAPPVIPVEPQRTGLNKKTFFVCNEPGTKWIRLPPVTPQQITVARNIKKFFTGRLNAPVISYPPFPGLEAHYLRAQIARISASSHVSPTGFFNFNEDEEEELEEGAVRENFIANTEFEAIPVRDLADPGLENWVHHSLYILDQGRASWWNPAAKKSEEEEEEEAAEEEVEEEEPPEPEVPPPLLTPISEDKDLDGIPAWSPHLSSKLVPQFAIAVIHSNVWPGAHAFASGHSVIIFAFENIYIGWGHKFTLENYSPMPPPPVMTEFPSGPEISEHDDPTPEQEAAWRAAQQEAEEEEDDEEGEDDEGDDEDEDD